MGQRIDQADAPMRRNLDEAKLWEIGQFADELGVVGKAPVRAELGEQLVEMRFGDDEFSLAAVDQRESTCNCPWLASSFIPTSVTL